MNYKEDTWQELGVSYTWYNTNIKDSIKTRRGTLVEMIERPNWGVACYMDNAIQSCEIDEKYYHESLVHPAMGSVTNSENVMIIGGGEGATLREVLKHQNVKKVDMYEWDEDVVTLFKNKYSQWSNGAWNDIRLTLYYDDIFNTITNNPLIKYDVIIIDLFDPDETNVEQWKLLLQNINNWLKTDGSIVIYSGIRNIIHKKQPYNILYDIIKSEYNTNDKELIPYKVYIPSFSGESTFILLKNKETKIRFQIDTHLTNIIWESYKTFNW